MKRFIIYELCHLAFVKLVLFVVKTILNAGVLMYFNRIMPVFKRLMA